MLSIKDQICMTIKLKLKRHKLLAKKIKHEETLESCPI